MNRFISFHVKAVASVETFNGCLTVIEHTNPDFILLENVPKLDADPKGDEEFFGCIHT